MIPPILREVLSFGSSNITGYLRQEDDEFAGWEALIAHLLGEGSNHVTSCAKRNESGEYLISFSKLFYLFGYLFSNIGDNVQLMCKGGK